MKTNFNLKYLQCLIALIIFLTSGVNLHAAVSDSTAIIAPSNLTAAAFNNTSVDLHWTDNSNDEAGFRIEYKKSNESTWQAGGQTLQNVTTFRVLSLQPNNLYNFRVNAFRGNMSSTYSNTASAFVGTDTLTLNYPAAPTGLTITFLSAYKGRLHWTDNSNNETGFVIDYKKASDSAWVNHLQAGQNQTEKDANGVQPGTVYNFRVRAFNPSGYSGYSNTATGTTPWDSIIYGIPNAPSGLTATAFGSRIVRLAWNDNSNNEAGFKIERRKADSTSLWGLIATIGSNRNAFGDSTVMPNTTYSYRVYAFDSAGVSGYTNIATVRTTSGNVLNPVAPNGITPLLSWNNIPQAIAYRVTIALDENFDAVVLQSENISNTQYQVANNSLSPNMNYYYRVTGFTSDNTEAGTDVGNFQTGATGIIHYNNETPAAYSLKQNYPNPFNPTTSIKFEIVKSDFVKMEIFDGLGRKIDELINAKLNAGSYSVEWNAARESSGIYYYRISTSDFTKTMKMILVK